MKIFEQAYDDVKLRHHTIGRYVTDPIFCVHIFRKSALKKPYVETVNDDTEITHKLLEGGYKVIYDKALFRHVTDNPLQPRLTVKGILRRRQRTEKFRKQAKKILNTNRFSIATRLGEFTEAVFLTLTRVNAIQFLEFIEFLVVMLSATVAGNIRLMFVDKDEYIRVR